MRVEKYSIWETPLKCSGRRVMMFTLFTNQKVKQSTIILRIVAGKVVGRVVERVEREVGELKIQRIFISFKVKQLIVKKILTFPPLLKKSTILPPTSFQTLTTNFLFLLNKHPNLMSPPLIIY